jgi:two-component system, OmpR family, response regulator
MNKILHIEDEVDIQEVARIALEDVGGFSVTVVGSGREGLAAARRSRPDVILLDVMMPGMDGPTTLQELRRAPSTASIPVIFMTAKAQAHEIERYLALGALGVITKPFDPMTLAEEVTALLRADPHSRQ